MANGTNSMRDNPFPGTRGKSAYLVREQYIKAREYQRKLDAAGDDESKKPPRDLHLESLVEAMREALPSYRRQHAELNEKALRAGWESLSETAAPAWEA